MGAVLASKTWSVALAGELGDCSRERLRDQRSDSEDHQTVVGELAYLFAQDGDAWMRLQRIGDRLGEALAVHRKRATGRHAVVHRTTQDQRTQPPHLRLEQPRRALRGVGTQGVGADQLPEQ